MTFKQTTLWKVAFEEARDDATPEQQAALAAHYEAMRQRASSLVARIRADLPHMTIHDVTHLDALWEMASLACGTNLQLNPAEAFVFGGAVLLHDSAMTLAAFPDGRAGLQTTEEWKDLYAHYSASISENDTAAAEKAKNRATEDALRLLHAKQAEKLPKAAWKGPNGQPMFIIESEQIREFYGPAIGKIAHSHWWPIATVEEKLAGTLGAPPGVTDCTVDLLKIACLLRVADAMHLDQRRAPAFEFALSQPEGISADHWKFQGRMAKPFVRSDALVYTAQPAFEVEIADAWWVAYDALQMVDRELRNVDRVLRERNKPTLVVRRVEGVHSPTDLARTVETVGWSPVDSTVRVSDVPKIVATLGGSKLYGDSVDAPVRELIQNGLDAITARRSLQRRPSKWGELHVGLEKRDDGYWLFFEDNGVGMSPLVLTGPLIDFGNSFWKSSLAIDEFPGLISRGMKARGRYGIGFFSIFMLGDHVRVVTRRFDRDMQSARVLEFRGGLGSRPNLREPDPGEAPLDGGTRVEVKLKKHPTEQGGLLHRGIHYKGNVEQLNDMVASIAPAADVAIKVTQDGQLIGSTEAGDWLEIDDNALLRRVGATPKALSGAKLSELRDADGRIYGRARIDTTSSAYNPAGLITVDGLAAVHITWLAGILMGVETTASRNAAKPIIPASVLAAWASEQTSTIRDADLPAREKAKAAATIMACGGDFGDLPIVQWNGEWLGLKDFVAAIKHLDKIYIHDGEISHDDDDYVTRNEFHSEFKTRRNVILTIDFPYLEYKTDNWITSVTRRYNETPVGLIDRAIISTWGDAEETDDSIVVGHANGVEIYRNVTVWERPRKQGSSDR